MTRGRPEPAKRNRKNGQYMAESKGCFIATAVYGDFNSPEVMKLRTWRNQVLIPTRAGRIFVAFYYLVSPPIARFLVRHPSLARQVRKLLDRFIKVTAGRL